MKASRTKYDKKPNMDCINLLTSILVCYPEITRVSFEPEGEEVHLKCIIDRELNEAECTSLRIFFTDSLMAYYYLEGIETEVFSIEIKVQEKATYISIKRDVASFSHGEIRMFSALVKEKLGDKLNSEFERVPLVDANAENIDTMLGSIKINPVSECMVGIREDGRVIVFNK